MRPVRRGWQTCASADRPRWVLLHATRVERAESVAGLLAGLDDDSVQRLAAAIEPLERIV